jgi:hypothetical protein
VAFFFLSFHRRGSDFKLPCTHTLVCQTRKRTEQALIATKEHALQAAQAKSAFVGEFTALPK